MLQIAVCDDEKLYLNEVLKILHETLDGTPNKIQTFQNSAFFFSYMKIGRSSCRERV